MEKILKLIAGQITGIVLLLLNNEIVHSSISSVISFFDPTRIDSVTIFLMKWASRLIVYLSFIGIILTIIYSILIIINISKMLNEKK